MEIGILKRETGSQEPFEEVNRTSRTRKWGLFKRESKPQRQGHVEKEIWTSRVSVRHAPEEGNSSLEGKGSVLWNILI